MLQCKPLMESMFTRERDVAIDAARQAARLIRASAGRLLNIREKGPSDLVTSADEASQALIIRLLREAFPAYDVLAEEGGRARLAPTGERRWIIDPIDGTTNFAHGLPPYAVSIALQRAEDIVLGVVLEVASGDLFMAMRGCGTWRNGAPVQVSSRQRLADCVVATGFPYRAFDQASKYLEVLHGFMVATRGVRRFGAASVDLAYVACGLFDGFFESGLHAWDVAAGALLVEEAGGRVTDYANAPNPLFAGQIVASNAKVHDEMLALVAALR